MSNVRQMFQAQVIEADELTDRVAFSATSPESIVKGLAMIRVAEWLNAGRDVPEWIEGKVFGDLKYKVRLSEDSKERVGRLNIRKAQHKERNWCDGVPPS